MQRIGIIGALALALVPGPAAAQTGAGGAYSGRNLQRDLELQLPSDVVIERQRDLLPQLGPGSDDGANAELRDYILGEWRKKIEQVIIPAGPGATSDDMGAAALRLGAGCTNILSLRCGKANALGLAGQAMALAGKASPTCETAAAKFREVYSSLSVDDVVARDYDLACLGSFARRVGDPTGEANAHRPAILQGAEAAGGLLDLVGLLEIDGKVVCGGLLRADRTFVTARHCVRALANVPLRVRSASKKFPAMPVVTQRHPDWSKLGVAADWAVLQLESGAPLPVPQSRLMNLALPGEISLIGFYRYAQATNYVAGDVTFERDLRFPKQGLCQAIEALSGCLQIACQTVRGFSGTPIFASRGADGSVEVVGFLSGADGSDTGCRMNSNVKYSSFAVSAGAVTAN